jgi:hypothetical protein
MPKDRRYHGKMKHDSEHRMEEKDGHMIGNESSKFANLPTEVMMKAYPPCPAYMDWEMQDNIKGIDRQEGNDNAARRRGFSPHKY